jgi:hypothetical protein
MPQQQDYLSTAEFAESRRVQPQTVRAQLSKTGSYYGEVPVRGPNGRLLWTKTEPRHSHDADARVLACTAKALKARRAKCSKGVS